MADRFYDYNNGDDADNGSTAALARASRSTAVSSSTAGDRVIAVDGDHAHESGFFDFNDNRIESSETFRGARLQANPSQTTRVARTSGSNTPQAVSYTHLTLPTIYSV